MINISKRKSYVEQKTSYYTRVIIVGIVILFVGILGLLQLSILSVLIIIGLIICNYGLSKRQRWGKGAKGEKIVAKKLNKLSRKYIILNEVKIPNLGGDIDHIVVGPTGIYIIETKNYSPTYIPDENVWYHKSGRIAEVNPARQVKLQTSKLNNFINHKMKTKSDKISVHSIISPINHNIIYKYKINSYKIVYPENLVHYISNQQNTLNHNEIREIVNILNKHGNFIKK